LRASTLRPAPDAARDSSRTRRVRRWPARDCRLQRDSRRQRPSRVNACSTLTSGRSGTKSRSGGRLGPECRQDPLPLNNGSRGLSRRNGIRVTVHDLPAPVFRAQNGRDSQRHARDIVASAYLGLVVLNLDDVGETWSCVRVKRSKPVAPPSR